MLTQDPLGREMRQMQSLTCGYGFGYDGDIMRPLALLQLPPLSISVNNTNIQLYYIYVGHIGTEDEKSGVNRIKMYPQTNKPVLEIAQFLVLYSTINPSPSFPPLEWNLTIMTIQKCCAISRLGSNTSLTLTTLGFGWLGWMWGCFFQ